MLGQIGVRVFVSSLASKVVYQSVHVHCFEVSSEAFRSYVYAMSMTESTASLSVITGARTVHKILCEGPWNKDVAIFCSTLEACSPSVSVKL